MGKRLLHPGPIFALSIISFCFLTSIITIISWLPPNNLKNILNAALFHFWVANILKNFFKACFIGPGHVDFKWTPKCKEDRKLLQYCECCEGYKSPRAHHCKTCKRCVMKMDHHCPWINNCVGHYNHKSFTCFLIFVVVGCSHAAIMMIFCIIDHLTWKHGYMLLSVYKDALIVMNHYLIIVLFFGIGLSAGVSIAVGILLYYQMKSIIRNKTGIEEWIVEKAITRSKHLDEPFIYPYDLGFKENLKQVLTWSGDYTGDGYTWPVVKGCDQYTLTIEQLEQKDLKRDRTIPYYVIKDYSGTWCPLRLGCRVLFDCPWSDEPRLKVTEGDTFLGTRHKRHWIYGERVFEENEETKEENVKKCHNLGETRRIKGWVPRVQLQRINEQDSSSYATSSSDESDDETENKKTK